MTSTFLFLIILELFLYVLWVVLIKDKSLGNDSKIKISGYFMTILTNAMLLIVILLVWQIFRMNLDFGLVLGGASLFAGASWILGRIISVEILRQESKSFFFILLFIFCLRSFAYEPYQIPSSSMYPGLQIGDFVLVNKFAYGLRLPTAKNTFFRAKSPDRGDVAVFMPPHTICGLTALEARPDLASLPSAEAQIFLESFHRYQDDRCTTIGIKYVKRIIAVQGDLVELDGNELSINGKKLTTETIETKDGAAIIKETLDNRIYMTRNIGDSLSKKYTWVVPKEHYLAFGDNRDNSLDSRAWGYVSSERLVGRADYIWMHWPSFSSLPTFKRNRSIH